MAKWGEGDPRWIVEEREDAKNVNNWHWSEKNATQWSKDYLKKCLVGVKMENDEITSEITEISKMDGEALANNRKGKVIIFYEWELEMDWKGQFKNSDNKTEYKGKIEVPNLSEEYSAPELSFTVSLENSSSDALKVKEFIRLDGVKVIREKLSQYIQDLKIDFSKDLILPTKKSSGQTTAGDINKPNLYKKSMNEVVTIDKKDKKSLTFSTLTLEDEFFCTPNDLFQAFVNKDLVSAFSRSSAQVDGKVGGAFSEFGDTVTGNFTELSTSGSACVIGMKWRHKDWPINTFSQVELKMTAIESGTKLELTQMGIPDTDYTNTHRGWVQNYFQAIKQTFGYGGRFF